MQKSLQITTQKMKFSIEDSFSKCDQFRSFLRNYLRICSHLLMKSLTENFIFCAVNVLSRTEILNKSPFRHCYRSAEKFSVFLRLLASGKQSLIFEERVTTAPLLFSLDLVMFSKTEICSIVSHSSVPDYRGSILQLWRKITPPPRQSISPWIRKSADCKMDVFFLSYTRFCRPLLLLMHYNKESTEKFLILLKNFRK